MLSDTHGKMKNIKNEIEKHDDLACIIHLGDYSSDAEKIIGLTHVPVEYVLGNCDYGQLGSLEKVISLGETKILLTHGHRENVKMTLDKLYYKAKEAECDIALYGHSHVRYVEEEDILMINPGSFSLGKGGTPNGYCVLDINEQKTTIKYFDV